MTKYLLDYEAHLVAFSRESELLALASADALVEPVPTCPDWSVRDLVEHLGSVFVFWRAQLESGDPDGRRELGEHGSPAGSDLVGWYSEAAHDLLVELTEHDATDPCWNWSGANPTARWVARRMALEAAVHRFDAELAAGSDSTVPTDLAVDGIDERIAVHLAADLPEETGATLGGVICLACSDSAAAWTVEIAGGRLRWRKGRGPADAVLVGTASDLFLFTWNRVRIDALELTGSVDVASAWKTLPV